MFPRAGCIPEEDDPGDEKRICRSTACLRLQLQLQLQLQQCCNLQGNELADQGLVVCLRSRSYVEGDPRGRMIRAIYELSIVNVVSMYCLLKHLPKSPVDANADQTGVRRISYIVQFSHAW